MEEVQNRVLESEEYSSSSISPDNEYKVEQFTLEEAHYKELSDLITTAFLNDEAAKKEGGTLVFTEETFRRIFGSPYMPKDLFIRAVHVPTNETVGFIGCIPRKIALDGKTYRCAVPAWAAVHWKHQRKGLSVKMGIKIREVLIDNNYDMAFSFHEPEQHGKDLSSAVTRETDLIPLKRIATIKHFMIRVFDVKEISKVFKLKKYEQLGIRILSPPNVKYTPNPKIRKYEPKDAERLFELMNDHVEKNQMAIVREHDDFLWYLDQPGVNCVVHENNLGEVDGFLLAWKFVFAGFGFEIPFGWLDLVHTYRLSQKDATDLCKYFSFTSKELGWKGLQMPYIPYFDSQPFKKAKYLFFPKRMNVDVFYQPGHSKINIPDKLENFYFDWR